MFNLYTDKLKTNRPKIKNDFVRFLVEMGNRMKSEYTNPSMPWLRRQKGPIVMKGIFKPKENSVYPTVSISPYGHVEILGAKGPEQMLLAYNILVKAFSILPPEVKEVTKPTKNWVPNKPKRTYVKQVVNVQKYNISTLTMRNLNKNSKNRFIIKKNVCKTLPKNVLVLIANHYGVASKGTKDELCKRISDLMSK